MNSDYGLSDERISQMSATDGLGMAISILCKIASDNYEGILGRDIADLKDVLRAAKQKTLSQTTV